MIEYKIWQKFWNRTYIWWEIKKWRRRYIYCECKCWNKTFVDAQSLRKWRSTKCRECAYHWNLNTTKHWDSNTRFYKIWHSMKQRCNCKTNTAYDKYWWRWIKVSNKRALYKNFKNDMYESYLKHVDKYWEYDTTLERIDVNWWYNKDNCKWATIEEQSNNKRNSHFECINWKRYTINQLSKLYNIPPTTICNRLKRWLSIIDALKSYKKNEDTTRTVWNEKGWSKQPS